MKTTVLAIFLSMAATVLTLAVVVVLDLHEQVLQLLAWIDARGILAGSFFVLVLALVVVLVLPGLFFTLGAGFLFGVIMGTVYVVLANIIGGTIAFLIARHGFSGRFRRYLSGYPNLARLHDRSPSEGWKLVMLTRLIPFFPFKISNYFFGLTAFPLSGFVFGTALGVVPLSVHNVYLGSLAADLSLLGTGQSLRSGWEWMLYGMGFIVTVISVLYLQYLARRLLDDQDDSIGTGSGQSAISSRGGRQ